MPNKPQPEEDEEDETEEGEEEEEETPSWAQALVKSLTGLLDVIEKRLPQPADPVAALSARLALLESAPKTSKTSTPGRKRLKVEQPKKVTPPPAPPANGRPEKKTRL